MATKSSLTLSRLNQAIGFALPIFAGLLWVSPATAQCVCGFDDGLFTLATISVDGDTSDWAPTPDGNGVDASVTDIRINPKGVFLPSSGAGNPGFNIGFRVRVDQQAARFTRAVAARTITIEPAQQEYVLTGRINESA